jgi:hypothetical protein
LDPHCVRNFFKKEKHNYSMSTSFAAPQFFFFFAGGIGGLRGKYRKLCFASSHTVPVCFYLSFL